MNDVEYLRKWKIKDELNLDFSFKTEIKFKDDLFLFPLNKIRDNSKFLYLNEPKSEILLIKENKEDLENFLKCFIDELLHKEKISNLQEIIDLCLHYNFNHSLINYFIMKIHKQEKSLPHLYLLKSVNLCSEKLSEKKIIFNEPNLSYNTLKRIFFKKEFLSKKVNNSFEKINYTKNKFQTSNLNFLNELDSFFDNNSSIISLEDNKFFNFRKDQILDYNNIESQRLVINKQNQIFITMIKHAVIIQKYFRRYLVFCQIYKPYNALIKNRLIKKILLIQTIYRRFCSIKKSKYLLIMKKINLHIFDSKQKIYSCIRSCYLKNKIRITSLKEKVKEIRNRSVLKLQISLRKFFIRKNIKRILFYEKNFLRIDYPFKAKNVKLKIFLDEYKFQLYEFFFCKIQKIFILYLNPINLISTKFRSQFLVDELITCDGRYPHIEYHDNLFYNLIDFSISENKIENLNDSNESKSILDKFENC